MKAVVVRAFGGPEQLAVVELPTPEPGAGEALLRVEAAGVCYHDVLDRAGKLPGHRDLPRILGHEIAATVVALGAPAAADATGLPQAPIGPGDRVAVFQRLFCGTCGTCQAGRQDLCRRGGVFGTAVPGGYGEYLVAPVRTLVRLPDGVAATDAALAACPIGTSIRALHGVAHVAPGETVLITGAGGGLGLHQIQLVRAAGAVPLAVTSSEGKVEQLRASGADQVFVSPDLQFGRAVWEWTDKQGVDIVLENVVGGTFEESLRVLGAGGRLVVLGNIDVAPVALNPGLVIVRRLQITGSGNCTLAELGQAVQLIASGQVRPVVGMVVPFPEAARAHAAMERRAVVGRAVLSGW